MNGLGYLIAIDLFSASSLTLSFSLPDLKHTQPQFLPHLPLGSPPQSGVDSYYSWESVLSKCAFHPITARSATPQPFLHPEWATVCFHHLGLPPSFPHRCSGHLQILGISICGCWLLSEDPPGLGVPPGFPGWLPVDSASSRHRRKDDGKPRNLKLQSPVQ